MIYHTQEKKLTQLVLAINKMFSFSWLSASISNFISAIEEKNLERQTFRELSALSDRELNDIGISRAIIHDIARGNFSKSGNVIGN